MTRELILIKTGGQVFRKLFVDEIMYYQAYGAYTIIYMLDHKKVVATLPLSEVEKSLSHDIFIKINRSQLVSLYHMSKLHLAKEAFVELTSGIRLKPTKKFVISYKKQLLLDNK